MRLGIFGLGGFAFAGCAGPVPTLYPAPAGTAVPVYVVNHGGMHTGLVLRTQDLDPAAWTAHHDYATATYLEVGWGDDDGYRKDLTTGIVAKALVWSPRTVLLLDGFGDPLWEHFSAPRTEIVEVGLSPAGHRRLVDYISATHAVDADGRPVRLDNDWYRARPAYSLFHTCNTWVAEALRAAGCPIVPRYCVTPGPLMHQVKTFGRTLAR